MDSSSMELALQTNEKLFSNFELVIEFLTENRKFCLKTEKYSKE